MAPSITPIGHPFCNTDGLHFHGIPLCHKDGYASHRHNGTYLLCPLGIHSVTWMDYTHQASILQHGWITPIRHLFCMDRLHFTQCSTPQQGWIHVTLLIYYALRYPSYNMDGLCLSNIHSATWMDYALQVMNV